jgi:hypothetical protein
MALKGDDDETEIGEVIQQVCAVYCIHNVLLNKFIGYRQRNLI